MFVFHRQTCLKFDSTHDFIFVISIRLSEVLRVFLCISTNTTAQGVFFSVRWMLQLERTLCWAGAFR